MTFTGPPDHSALRTVTRAYVVARRKDMESRILAPAGIRRKLSALSSLFDYLCERNAVLGDRVIREKKADFVPALVHLMAYRPIRQAVCRVCGETASMGLPRRLRQGTNWP
jgi:site-specific recombinase XerD